MKIMLRFLKENLLTTSLALAALTATSCGRPTAEDQSGLDWIKSRTDTERYAYLEEKDLEDDFLFGASVVKTKGFASSALDVSINPTPVKLVAGKVKGSDKIKLLVLTEDKKPLMGFDIKELPNSKVEIDFASAGNDVAFNKSVDKLGALSTTGSHTVVWTSKGKPTVERIIQDKDTVIVDIVHTLLQQKRFRMITEGKNKSKTDDNVDEDQKKPGQITLRLYLIRRSSLPKLSPDRTVGDASEQSIGYFSSDMSQTTSVREASMPIQRFALGDQFNGQGRSATFYLKDVPAEFLEQAKKAVLSWNKAFGGGNMIKVAVAPESLDVGDPRFHVIKWYDGLDEEVPWAGVARMMVDPKTGLVFSGNVYINGSSVINNYVFNDQYTRTVAKALKIRIDGTIGQGNVVFNEGETPVVPFFTDVVSKDYKSYMQGYYLATIAHEVGHVLGLRHNFRGGNTLDKDGVGTSVMAYAPRTHRNRDTGPGSYDIAAIQWGYFGKKPQRKLAYCSDEHVLKLYDCNRGTLGEPVNYIAKGLVDSAKVFASVPIKVENDKKDSLFGTFSDHIFNFYKILILKDQIPEDKRSESLATLADAYRTVHGIQPHESLSDEEKDVAQEHLRAMKLIFQSVKESIIQRQKKDAPAWDSKVDDLLNP